MTRLKLGAIEDDKPVKLTIELPAALHRDLVAYGEALARETGQATIEPAKLIAPTKATNNQIKAPNAYASYAGSLNIWIRRLSRRVPAKPNAIGA